MGSNLMESWQLELIDPRELAIILRDVFGSESVAPGRRVTTFGSNAGYQVQIEFDKTGRPLKCRAQRTPATVLRRIAERIQMELVETAGDRIGRSIVMLEYDIDRSWRYGDELAITPAARDMARQPAGYIGPAPAIFECAIPISTNERINVERHDRKLRDLSLVLNVLFDLGLSLPATNQSWLWVDDSDFNTGTRRARYVQSGYRSSIPIPQGGNFMADGYQSLPRVPDTDYFNRVGISNRSFDLPEGIDQLFGTYVLLTGDNRAAFLRAAFWYRCAFDTRPVSTSLAVVALVTSIEALTGSSAEPGRCECCGRTMNTPTAAFNQFLEQVLPGSHSAKFRRRLYDARSAYVHGSGLSSIDEVGFGGLLTPHDAEDAELWAETKAIVRLALVNHLRLEAGLEPLEWVVRPIKLHVRGYGHTPLPCD
jgi:hypothetical protein